MAVLENSSGTQVATLDTEHTLATISTSGGTFVLEVDLNALVAGDVVVLRVYDKTLSGSTSRLVYDGTYAGVQSKPIVITKPIAAAHEVVFSLEQTDGTGRSFDWSVRQLDG